MKTSTRVLFAVGAAFGVASAASAQLETTARAVDAADGNARGGVTPSGETEFLNFPWDGSSSFGSAAQDFEAGLDQYDIWVVDDFSAAAPHQPLEFSSTGFVVNAGDGTPGDPFLVEGFVARVYTAPPNEASAEILSESTSFDFNGVDTWTASDFDNCIPAGDFFVAFQAVNNFSENEQTFFFQQSQEGLNDAFHWNPGGAFDFPDNVSPILDQSDNPTGVNMVFTGEEIAECGGGGPSCDLADCNDDEDFNILDFVCYQELFSGGDPAADCNEDEVLNILDFVCFQELFSDCAG